MKGSFRFQSNDSPFAFSELLLDNGSAATIEGAASLTVGQMVIQNGSSRSTGAEIPQGVLNLQLNNLTVAAGSRISADGVGYPANRYGNPGKGVRERGQSPS